MKELDFLFLYEHKVRELENLCLIKYELDRRGYRTEIRYIEDIQNSIAVKPFIHTKVLLVMACYNNQTLEWQTKNFVKFDKVIDMQWENIVYPKDEVRSDAYKNYTEIGKDVVRISWGKQNERRMLSVVKMDPRKLKVTGHVGMDFLRPPLTGYYMSREELFEKYGVPREKKVILFASPYYGDKLPDVYINDMCARFGEDWVDYYRFMCDSQEIVLQWFEKLLLQDKDLYIVFRPHPGHSSRCAERLERINSNFKIISGESVKQWIIACDKVYTGNSSVVVEAFFAKKMCQLLFPVPVTKGFELKLIQDSLKLTDYVAFKQSVYASNAKFPVSQDRIEDIYLIDWEEPSYIKFADAAEEVLKDEYYTLTKQQLRAYRTKYKGTLRLVKTISQCDVIYKLYLALLENKKIRWEFLEKQRQIRENAVRIQNEHSHELTNEQEIRDIIKRIDKALK